VFDWLLDFVGGSPWAYAAIFAIVAIDAFFPLVPGETSVVTGGILASNGEHHISIVFLAGMAGAVIGDNISYVLGRRLGPWAERRLFTSERAQERRRWACRQLNDRGPWIIVASRFIPGGRTAVTFSAGGLDYPWRRFIAADLVAGAVWAAFAAGLGWFGGNAFKESLWKPLAIAAAAAVIVSVAGELFVRATERRAARTRESAR
jgi:membrane protein DedA with SNARE-associated domain